MSPGITLTGVDERTWMADLRDLVDRGAEIGVLFTLKPEGRNRYPSVGWIQRVLHNSENVAVHVCGSLAREAFLAGHTPWIREAKRIQINGKLDAAQLGRAMRQVYAGTKIITQHTAANEPLAAPEWPAHQLLVDASGGRGIAPAQWVRPKTSKPVGFAGGLGPDTLGIELPRIASVAREPYWIDMESSLRDADDWFDADRAHLAVDRFEEFTGRA